MNSRQERALQLLRADPKSTGYNRRDLYEGASQTNPKNGSGEYWITYSSGFDYEPLTRQDIDELLAARLIKKKWPGCYELDRKDAT